jgi:hypothetical protein
MGSLIGQGIVGIVLPALLALILNGLVLRATALAENRKWPFVGLIIAVCFAFSYLVFGSLLLNGALFSDLPWPTAGLLWLAPFGVLIGPPASSSAANRNLLLRGLIVLVGVGLAFAALFLISPPHGNEY